MACVLVTQRLLEAAKAAGVSHFYYISIVGIDRIKYAYYNAKLAAETAIEEGGVPYTILRAPQVQTLSQIAGDWLRARGRRPLVVPIPALGPLGSMAKGHNCCPENTFGKITWREWLTKR